MRRVPSIAIGFSLVLGCAAGDDKGESTTNDASSDVAPIEVSTDDTGSAADSEPTESGADTNSESGSETSVVDSGGDTSSEVSTDTGVDAAPADVATEASTDSAVAPWRKTIVIDGTNDFSATDEKLSTTSTGYDAFVTWDADALYVGYSGPDIGASASTTKWVFVYLDADPGTSSGASKSEQYNEQAATFPSGFGAEAYFAWRTDGAFSQAKKYAGSAWSTVATPGVTVARTGSFVEMRIPFSLLGTTTPAKIGTLSFMMNEGTGQWTYAGLYSGSFTDGFYKTPATAPVTNWLQVDLASSSAPSSLTNRKP
ncbi:MAG: hypothetical protein ACXVEE_11760 [Polyangiales bacterium]